MVNLGNNEFAILNYIILIENNIDRLIVLLKIQIFSYELFIENLYFKNEIRMTDIFKHRQS